MPPSAEPPTILEAHVLRLAPHAGDFTLLTFFSAAEGVGHALLRAPGRRGGAGTEPAPDLFDRLALVMDRPRAGADGPRFVRELRLLARHPGIGRDYEALAHASRLARVVARNPVPAEGRAGVDRLLGVAFAAFGRTGARPDAVYWKSLYVIAREEGHPVREQWLPALPPADRELAAAVLARPAHEVSATPAEVAHLVRRLETYLSGHADFHFD